MRSTVGVVVLLALLGGSTYAYFHHYQLRHPPVSSPADPLAASFTRKVFQYLLGLPNKTNKKVVSGQMIDTVDLYRSWSEIAASTGYTPGMMCQIYGPTKGDENLDLNLLEKHWNAGGLVQIVDDSTNPKTLDNSTNFTSADFASLLTPGTTINNNFMRELSELATQLRILQNAGVVVLLRQFHEMNANWYWWSNGTPRQYIRLWQMQFKYLTQTVGLHNLLFVYAPTSDPNFAHYGTFYPGDNYADIVGVDYYLDAVTGQPIPKADGYDQFTTRIAPSKPFAITEFGPIPADIGRFSPHDYSQLIAGIKQSMPKVVYWQSWRHEWTMAVDPSTGQSHLNVRQLLADPWVANLGDLTLPSTQLSDR